MTISQNPIRTTIFYGLICGLSFIPVYLALNYMLAGPSATCLALCLFGAGYSLLLSRWSGKPIPTIIFPLLLLFMTVFLVDSIAAFFLLSLVVISWIRSGICFRNPAGIRLAVELLTLHCCRSCGGRIHTRFCNGLGAGRLDVLLDSVTLFCDF